MLLKAQRGHYAVPAFNINNLEILQSVVAAAVTLKSPVIIQTSEGAIKYAGSPSLPGQTWRAGMAMFAAMVRVSAEQNPKIPIAFHLDHGTNYELVKEAIKSGFYTSVMYDGSAHPFAENIKRTKEIVKLAHAHKPAIQVEAELGAIPGQEDTLKVAAKDAYFTDPKLAQEFVSQTGCDSLAIAIGTVHGVYKFRKVEPSLDFDRLKQIKKLVKVPLVLHGASEIPYELVTLAQRFGAKLGGARGVTNRLLSHAVKLGINKVNIDSDLRLAFDAGVREFLAEKPSVYDPRKILSLARKFMTQEARGKIKLFGSRNKA